MKRIIAIAAMMIVGVFPALGQVGTTTGGPLTVAGVPICGIGDNGDLYWYFHQGAHNGSALWANSGQRVQVGTGWNEGRMVFKGDPRGNDGVIYRVDSKGNLYWYKHLGHATGSQDWIDGKKVGNGWQDVRIAFERAMVSCARSIRMAICCGIGIWDIETAAATGRTEGMLRK